jgi:hypothetical protein
VGGQGAPDEAGAVTRQGWRGGRGRADRTGFDGIPPGSGWRRILRLWGE